MCSCLIGGGGGAGGKSSRKEEIKIKAERGDELLRRWRDWVGLRQELLSQRMQGRTERRVEGKMEGRVGGGNAG